MRKANNCPKKKKICIIMSVLSLFGKYDETYLKNLIIIPIIGQMLHF